MAKAPAFQLYVNDALRDTRVLSLEARGAWWDCLLMMWHAPERGVLRHTIDQFSRLFGADLGTAERVISEIESTGVADVVRSRNGDVTVIEIRCRRMSREARTTENTRLRVQKHRRNKSEDDGGGAEKRGCNADVTHPSSSSSSSSLHTHPLPREKSGGMDARVRELLAAFNIGTDPAMIGTDAMQAILAQPQFLEPDALDVIRQKAAAWMAQDWIRDVSPRLIAKNLAEIYNYSPNARRKSRASSSASRDAERTGLTQAIEIPTL